MDLLPQLRDTITRHQLLARGERLVVAVSGGADSTALADLLYRLSQGELPLCLALAYLDHGLRAQAAEEAAYVASLAQARGLRFFWDKIDLRSGGDSGLEERGRRLRYRFLCRCASEFKAGKVAVAHHADDQAETLLLHLLRGCGLHGLAAIPPLRPLQPDSPILLIRPLIDMRKRDISLYLRERGLHWFEDHSNDDLRFTRNRVRQRVIPMLQNEGFADVVPAIARTAAHCREIAVYLQAQAQAAFARARCDVCPARPDFSRLLRMAGGREIACAVRSDALDDVPAALLPFWLRLMLTEVGGEESAVEEGHYAMLEKMRQDDKGMIQLSGGITLWRTQGITCCERAQALPWQLPAQISPPATLWFTPSVALTATYKDMAGEARPPSLLEAWLDEQTVKPPLSVRLWQAGDVMWPLGAPGRRKVASILGDARLPAPLRVHALVISDVGGDIVWLPGIAIAHPCRLTTGSRRMLVLRCHAR